MTQVHRPLGIASCAFIFGLLASTLALAEYPFTYQGQLAADGAPYNGSVTMTFRLWDAGTEGTQIGADIARTVDVVDGLFQVVLDFGPVIDGSFQFLEIEVEGKTLVPRQPILPAPIALTAVDVIPGVVWRQHGNAGTGPGDFIGTTDDAPFEIHVDGSRALRLEPRGSSTGANIVAGYAGNEGGSSIANGTTVGGGGHSGQPNRALSSYATVAGGRGNTAAGSDGTVGGGAFNLTNGAGSVVAGGVSNSALTGASTVGGGSNNSAAELYSTVPGGSSNQANAAYSFAAGRRAIADHAGSFVWADATNADFASTGTNQFNVRAEGGAGFGEPPSDYFVISAPQVEQDGDYGFGTGALRVRLDGATVLRVLGNGGVAIGNSYRSSGVPPRGLRVSGPVQLGSLGVGGGNSLCLDANDQIGLCSSSQRYKTDIRPIANVVEIIDRLRPVSYRWVEDGEEGLGLVAEEVAEVEPRLVIFGEGGRIEGVKYRQLTALLVRAFQEQRAESIRMQSRIAQLRTLAGRLDALLEHTARLETRLAQLEASLRGRSQPTQGNGTAVIASATHADMPDSAGDPP